MNTTTTIRRVRPTAFPASPKTTHTDPPRTRKIPDHGNAVGPVHQNPANRIPKRIDTSLPLKTWDRVQIRLRDQQSHLLADTSPSKREYIPNTGMLPDPANWCATISACCIEVLVGTRPLSQLARWLTSEIYDGLEQRTALALRIEGPSQIRRTATVRSLHIQQIEEGSSSPVEGCALVYDGKRLRAVAIRLEAFRGRWRATALEIG